MEIEYWYDKNTLLLGEVEVSTDATGSALKISCLHVVVFIGGIDYDVTRWFEQEYPATFTNWKQSFERHCWEKHIDDLRGNKVEEGA